MCILFSARCRKAESRAVARHVRLINDSSMANFFSILCKESWENVYTISDPNKSFDIFLNTFLIYFNSCFHKKIVNSNSSPNNNMRWITPEIQKAGQNLRDLFYLKAEYPNDNRLSDHYKTCKKKL